MSVRPETYQLRAMVVKGARVSWEVPHAMQRAAERNVPIFVAERIIRLGTVTDARLDLHGRARWRVSGSDADGRPVDVVVTPIGEGVLRVITVIRTDE